MEFNKPKELSFNKRIALHALVKLSKEDAKVPMNEVVKHCKTTGERIRAAKVQYQLKDYFLAQDWNGKLSLGRGYLRYGPVGGVLSDFYVEFLQ